ncbi:MAG TPA: hypothetical protein VJV78_23745 [Polyangiales bacterium]|nr:hypothetical protein [Polyangiales bacterium]
MSVRHGSRWQHVACVACLAALFPACEGIGNDGTSRYLAERDETQSCLGAFTPNSKVCYDKTDEAQGPISTDLSVTEGFLDDVNGVDRCLQIGVPTPGTPGTLTVQFTTTFLGGTYKPKNVGAAWIEGPSMEYVRTIELWAGERVQSITLWAPRACQRDDNTIKDVVTSATLDAHKAHTRTWDGKDFRGVVAPDGQFTLWLQVTESEFVPEGPYIHIPFEKGPMPREMAITPMPGFTDIKLTWAPGAVDSGAVKP